MSRHWLVYTPPFPIIERILDDGTGPIYDESDVIEVEAESASDAKVLGVKVMIDDQRAYSWCKEQRKGGLCPYAGVKVEEVRAEK